MDLSILSGGINLLRRACQEARVQNPDVVLMLSSPTRGVLAMTGADAVGAYEKAGPIPVAGTYAELVTIAEKTTGQSEGTGQPIIPTAMTGWETRLCEETPTPWSTNPRGPSGEDYVILPPAWRNRLRRTSGIWSPGSRKNPQSCPAQTGMNPIPGTSMTRVVRR